MADDINVRITRQVGAVRTLSAKLVAPPPPASVPPIQATVDRPGGLNEITQSTRTTLTGFLYGNGSLVVSVTLGTAANADIGTTEGTVPVLGSGGQLPETMVAGHSDLAQTVENIQSSSTSFPVAMAIALS